MLSHVKDAYDIHALNEGSTATITYSEEYGIEVPVTVKSGQIVISQAHEDIDPAACMYVERLIRVVGRARELAGNMPEGNLSDMGGIEALICALCVVSFAENYSK